MAEISYPFAADSAGGGSQLVSQVQWQAMAHLFSTDCIDYQLTATSYVSSDLPFYMSSPGTGTITVHTGNAFVGGFYYQLTANKVMTLTSNTGSNDRIDLIVIRADLSTGSANLAIVQGQPASTPVEPAVTRNPGGVWEMSLASILVPANGGTVDIEDRRKFAAPGLTTSPWDTSPTNATLPRGSFLLDMDVNTSGGQMEYFRGTDGVAATRALGKRQTYTPDLFTVSNKPSAANRKGFWRVIAPGTVYFSAEFYNPSTKAVAVTNGVTVMAFTLPHPGHGATTQIFSGSLVNPDVKDNLPNLMSVTCRLGTTNNCYMYYPNATTIKEGLDGLREIPPKGILSVSGVYEDSTFR